MIVHNIEQGSEEWHEVRLGKFTASTIDNLFAAETTASYRNLVRRIAYERLTGEKPDDFKNDWMNRGNEMEPGAVEAYEVETMETIELVGFCESDDHLTGCSPDGLVGKDGMVQIKSPKYSTMFDFYQKGPDLSDKQFLSRVYFHQVQMEMKVTKRKWSDFVVYHPGLPLIIRRVKADKNVQAEMDAKISMAEVEISGLLNSVKNYSK